MYTTSTTVSSRIESYCRTWRMWLENDESVIMGDNIMSATSDVQSTSLSDDIELGAVCSQSLYQNLHRLSFTEASKPLFRS